jgi:putative phosphoribosyl transferase
MFKDREEAGRQLAERLIAYRDDPAALILALPRGGVLVAYPISTALRVPLDVFITRKLGAPGDPEFAIGAVAETGFVHLNPTAREFLDERLLSPRYLEHAVREQREEIARRQALYREGRLLPALADRTILLIDDGIATGATFFASVHALRALGVTRLVAAIPVGPQDTVRALQPAVDDLIVLHAPELFFAVGNFYADFHQVSDEDVIRHLKAAAAALTPRKYPAHA